MGFDDSILIRDLAVKVPGATRVFESFRIEYCCRGDHTLGEACAAAGVPVATVRGDLERAARSGEPEPWLGESLPSLVAHIVGKHHAYTREALDTLGPLATKVAGVHGARHAELTTLPRMVAELDEELRPHMLKEEHILFPYIEELDAAARGAGGHPLAPFGSVANPIRMMQSEHERCGEILRHMRETTADYTLPTGACASYTALFAGLVRLERDLHEHIHEESNVLFPRALALEET